MGSLVENQKAESQWYVYVRWRNWKGRVRRRIVGVTYVDGSKLDEQKALTAALRSCVWGWWTPSKRHGRGYRVSVFDHQEDLIESFATPRAEFDIRLIQEVYAENNGGRVPNGSTV